MLIVRTAPLALALAPREPGADTTGVPLKVTPAVVMVTVKSGDAGSVAARHAAEASVNVNVTVPADVPPRGTLPAVPTVTAPSAVEAAMNVNNDASSVEVKPTLIALRNLFKFSTSLYMG
jgi:hypothetical protein